MIEYNFNFDEGEMGKNQDQIIKKNEIRTIILEKMKDIKDLEITNYNANAEIEALTRPIKEKIDSREKTKQLLLAEVANLIKLLDENVFFKGIGSAGFRAMPVKWNYDEEDLKAKLELCQYEEFIKHESKVKIGELKKAINIKDGKPYLNNLDLSEHIKFEQQPKSFNWKVVM